MRTILLALGDKDLSSFLVGDLRDEGYRVLVASTAEDAIYRIALDCVSLVLLDEALTGLPAATLITRIRRAMGTAVAPAFLLIPAEPSIISEHLADAVWRRHSSLTNLHQLLDRHYPSAYRAV
jgi:CheY-like chemotaxis protein